MNRLLALHMHTHIIVLGTIQNHVIVDVVMTRLYVIDPELYNFVINLSVLHLMLTYLFLQAI